MFPVFCIGFFSLTFIPFVLFLVNSTSPYVFRSRLISLDGGLQRDGDGARQTVLPGNRRHRFFPPSVPVIRLWMTRNPTFWLRWVPLCFRGTFPSGNPLGNRIKERLRETFLLQTLRL